MGYTHYFDRDQPCPPEWWADLCADFRKLQATALLLGQPLPIQAESDDPSPPKITDEVIVFNGIGKDGYETFQLFRSDPSGSGFHFCKTQRRPYDIAVTALLCLVDYHAPDIWSIHSDGTIMDWIPGLTLARQVQPECKLPFGT